MSVQCSVAIFYLFISRDSSISDIRDQVEACPDGDGSGQWWSHPRLPHQGRQHGHAPGRHHQQRGDRQDDAGAGSLPQLQGQQEPDPSVPQRNPGHGPRDHRDSPARPRHHWGAGPAGLAGGSPGQESHIEFGQHLLRKLGHDFKITSINTFVEIVEYCSENYFQCDRLSAR